LGGKDAFDKEIENDAFTGSPIIKIMRMIKENDVLIAEGTVLRFISVVLIAAFFAAGAFAQEKSPADAGTAEENQASARASLRGVWNVTEPLSRVLGEGWVPVNPNVCLYIFTEKH
jgi:hypothetical protein